MFFKRKKPSTPPPAPAVPAGDEPMERESGPPTTQFLTGDQGADRRTVQVLLEAIARVSEFRDLDELLIDIVDRSIEITGAERGLLLLRGSDGGLLQRVGRTRGGKPLTGEVRFSTTIATRVLDEILPVRATVQSESEALELGKSVYDLKLRAVMCVPLAPPERGEQGGRPNGVLYVDSRAASRQFGQSDLSLFAALAQQISIALDNARLHFDSLEKVRLEQSLELAGAIQRDLMPSVPEDVPGYDLHGWYGPAEVAAGDFYDFLRVKGGKLGVVVGDVTGHGIGPALITASAQGSLSSYSRLISEPGEIVSLLNQDLSEKIDDGRFVTLFFALLADDGVVTPVNAGHAPPFVWRKATGEVELITGGGPAIGMLPDEAYTSLAPQSLDPGDVLVVYTDGLVEARSPENKEALFGDDGLRAALCDSAGRGLAAKEIALHLVESALELAGGVREDDITVVVVRRVE
ncbi:MAG: GAF domain-containing SpoIIE family protein phosphatase [Planctomycetota bacterium]